MEIWRRRDFFPAQLEICYGKAQWMFVISFRKRKWQMFKASIQMEVAHKVSFNRKPVLFVSLVSGKSRLFPGGEKLD